MEHRIYPTSEKEKDIATNSIFFKMMVYGVFLMALATCLKECQVYPLKNQVWFTLLKMAMPIR